MKIAVLGSGGREHTLVWKLSQSVGAENIFCLPGNGGIHNCIDISVNDFEGIKAFCETENIDLIVVGPEDPLTEGIVDFFAESAVKVFGPSKDAAVLEGSKIYSKHFMKKHGVDTANFTTFENVKEGIDSLKNFNGNIVIKYDGLAAGKGVFVCDEIEEAKLALAELKEKYGDDCQYLIEEQLFGDEISIIGITDGESIKLLQASQDHKQLLDGDKGPNTGGMGAYTPVPFCDEKLMNRIYESIINPTIKGIQDEQMDYKGFIYFGIMLTEKGPMLLEYNVRLGDPETEVILPALKNDLEEILLSCFDGSLKEKKLVFNEGYYIDVVQVSGGYPKQYEKGHPISGLDQLENDTLLFHAGTKLVDGEIVSNGGRVINVVCHGHSLNEAIEKVYSECNKVKFQNKFYRKDIGRRTLNARK